MSTVDPVERRRGLRRHILRTSSSVAHCRINGSDLLAVGVGEVRLPANLACPANVCRRCWDRLARETWRAEARAAGAVALAQAVAAKLRRVA